MIKSAIITAMVFGASCPATKVVNESKERWTNVDRRSLKSATVRCKQKYPRRSPCLIWFIKKDVQVYNAICGAPRKN